MTLTRIRRAAIASAAALLLFGATPVFATSTAVDLPTGMTLAQETPQNAVLGFEFSTTYLTTVTAIGIFDQGEDGFSSPHSAAIWDDAGNIVAQLLFSTNFGTVENGFRFIELLSPVQLSPGLKYVIGAFYSSTNEDSAVVASMDSEYISDPNITISGGRLTTGGFGLPDIETSDVFFGPNFRFTAVPLPAGGWLLLSALAGLALSRRR